MVLGRSSWAPAVLVALAAVTAGCAPAPAELVFARTTVDGQNVLQAYRTQTPIRAVVVFFHGLDRDANILDLDQPHRDLVRTLTDAGYAVVASDAGGNAFGNRSSQRNYAALVRDSGKRFGTNETYFLAESMGTVAAMNLMTKDTDISVRGLAAINPLLNLEHVPPTYRSAVQASYVDSSAAAESPLALPRSAMVGRYVRLYVTPSDSVVATDTNALAFQQRFGGVANVSIAWCSGDHLDPSCVRGPDVVTWFDTLQPP